MRKIVDVDKTVYECEKQINNKTIKQNKKDFKDLDKILNESNFKKLTDLSLLNLMFYYTTLKLIINNVCNENKPIATTKKITDIFNELTSRNYEFISISHNLQKK